MPYCDESRVVYRARRKDSMVRCRDLAVVVVLVTQMERPAAVHERFSVLPRPEINANCTACNRVAQGFLDLHSEWLIVSQMKMAGQNPSSHGPEGIGDGGDVFLVTYKDAIERFCKQTFLNGNQQRVCYSIVPFAAEVAQWLAMGIPPDRVCRKLGKGNPDICFDVREVERPVMEPVDWHNKPPSVPDGVEYSVEYRNSINPRWVLLD